MLQFLFFDFHRLISTDHYLKIICGFCASGMKKKTRIVEKNPHGDSGFLFIYLFVFSSFLALACTTHLWVISAVRDAELL